MLKFNTVYDIFIYHERAVAIVYDSDLLIIHIDYAIQCSDGLAAEYRTCCKVATGTFDKLLTKRIAGDFLLPCIHTIVLHNGAISALERVLK